MRSAASVALAAWKVEKAIYTVDGRNPAPVLVGSLSHYLQGFYTFQVLYIPGGAGFLPSTVFRLVVYITHCISLHL